MKDSGIEWLGEVPAYWDVKRLGYLCSDIKAGPFGSSLTKDMYVGEGYRIYGQEQVIPNDFTIGDYYISQDTYSRLQQYEVQQGDILISCVGTFGRIATVPDGIEPGIINPRLMRLRVNPGALPFPVEISLA
jgi:type I restriction enzyme S subunit